MCWSILPLTVGMDMTSTLHSCHFLHQTSLIVQEHSWIHMYSDIDCEFPFISCSTYVFLKLDLEFLCQYFLSFSSTHHTSLGLGAFSTLWSWLEPFPHPLPLPSFLWSHLKHHCLCETSPNPPNKDSPLRTHSLNAPCSSVAGSRYL